MAGGEDDLPPLTSGASRSPFTQQEQGIIVAWLQGYYLPENEPAVIDVERLLLDRAKLTEHCINEPDDDLMTAAEAVMEK